MKSKNKKPSTHTNCEDIFIKKIKTNGGEKILVCKYCDKEKRIMENTK